MTDEKMIVNAREIKKSFVIKSMQEAQMQKIEVLKGIDLTIRSGEYVSIMGRSGSGKTTLLKIIGLTLLPTEGEVFFKGQNAGGLWKDELADIRRQEIGFVFQDFGLLDSLSALDNIMLPGIVDKMEFEKAQKKAYGLAEQLELSQKLLKKAPYELSGGEKQRVAICRALINDPDLILADEPTGNLDEKSGGLVSEILTDINTSMNKTIVMVTHNPQLASMSEKMYLLRDGRIVERLENEGSSERFYQKILNVM